MKAKPSSTLLTILDTPPEEGPRRAKHFHASGLLECGRKQVAVLLGHVEVRQVKPEWRRAADVGNLLHDYITATLDKAGVLEAAELALEVDPEYFVSGRVDAVLSRNGNRRVCEIKSMSADKYATFRPGTNNIPGLDFENASNDKFEAAYWQLQYYLWSLKLEGGFLIAVNRDNLTIKEFSVTYDDTGILAILARMKRLKGFLDRNQLPPPERNKFCRWCGFHDTGVCRPQGEEWL